MTKEELEKYIDSRIEYYKTTFNFDYISEDDVQVLKDRINQMPNKDESIKEYIDNVIEKYIAVRINRTNNFKTQDYNDFQNIQELDISSISYEELNKMYFHFGPKAFAESYDKEGIKSHVGKNSKGIDKDPSIFFSQGVEGILKLWDVWIKWRLDRYTNPKHQTLPGEDHEERMAKYYNGEVSEDELREYFFWLERYNSKGLFKDQLVMHETYDSIYAELQGSYYYQINLNDDEYSKYQVDSKKDNALSRGGIPLEMAVMYGDYSDLNSNIVDDWNMQTIPGKDVTIDTDRIHIVTLDGNKDALGILMSLYSLYKSHVPEDNQIQFDVLNDFVEYIKKEVNTYQRQA